MMQNDFLQPITEEELNLLAEELLSERHGENVMTIDMVDGLLAGLLVGPEPVEPALWLPIVWDTTGEGSGAGFGSDEEARRIDTLLIRFMATIAELLQDEEEPYVPLFQLTEFQDDESLELAARSWAVGFVAAIELGGTAWEPLFDEKDAAALIGPVYLLAGLIEEADPITPEQQAFLMEILPESVYAISEFWGYLAEGEEEG